MAITPKTAFARKIAPLTFILLVAADLLFILMSIHYSFPTNKNAKLNYYFLISLPYIMIFISFCMFFFGDPGTIEKGLETDELVGGLTEEEKQFLPKCPACNQPNPPRTFHCYRCDQCHLKMNLHISIFGKCVAIKNQRPFIVLLKWCAVAQFINTFVALFCTIFGEIAGIIGFAIIMFYLAFGVLFEIFWSEEMSLVKQNQTHIERKKRVSSRYYDFGKEKNIEEVFGNGMFRYYIPSRSKMTGFEWIEED